MSIFQRFAALTLALLLPAIAQATEPTDDRVIEERVEIVEDGSESTTWMGIRLGSVLTPYRQSGPTRPASRVTSDQSQACLDPVGGRYCGNLRGFDLRVEMFEAPSRASFPRWTLFFRTGYSAGRFGFDPASPEGGFAVGDPRSLAYHAVPLFFGANIHLFEKFPIRPYGGLGFGFDVLRLHYGRHEASERIDASARIGFELHAGIEARITNYVSLNLEVMQLWSARRKMADLPDYSNGGLTFIGGVSFAIPTRHTKRKRVHTVRRTRRIESSNAPVDAATERHARPTSPVHVEVEVVQKQETSAAPPLPVELEGPASELAPTPQVPAGDGSEPTAVDAPPPGPTL